MFEFLEKIKRNELMLIIKNEVYSLKMRRSLVGHVFIFVKRVDNFKNKQNHVKNICCEYERASE